MRLRTPHLRPRDWLLVAVMGVLLTIGAAFVHSASYRSGPMGEGYYTTSPLKQVQWIVIGGFAFVAVLFVNYRILVEHGAVFYAVGIGLLAYVLKFGVSSETIVARRWIQVGPIRAQPSELMKVLVILAMARLLMYNDKHRTLGGLLAPFALVLLPMVLIAREPDLGTALVLLPVAFAMLYVAAARGRHLLFITALGAAAVPAVWSQMHDYQKRRVVSFFTQDDPHVKGQYHLRHAKVAVGAGQLFGRGLGKGTQNRLNFIPAKTRNNDFIFAVICEEWGFVGANLVLLLYLALLFLCILTAEDTHHPAGRLVIVGVVAMLGTQVIVNTSMTMGQLPIVGLTLPLVSYGGSSLVSSMMAIALVVNVSVWRQVALAGDDFDPEAAERREAAPMAEETFM